MRGRRMRRAAIAVGAVLGMGLLAGCVAGGGGTAGSGSGGGTGSGTTSEDRSAPQASAASGGGEQAVDGDTQAVPDAGRAIVRDGSLGLNAKDPITAATRIATLVTGAGGRIENLDQQPGGSAAASLVARIPATRFDAVLADIRKQGTVTNVQVGATDVTAQVTDYTVRIDNLRTSIDRLQALLAQAESATALIEIERSLTERETSLEQLLAQQQALDDQVAFATLSIFIEQPSVARNPAPTDFVGGLAVGVGSLVEAVSAFVVGLGVALPWLALLAVIGAGIFGVTRAASRAAARRKAPKSA